MRDIKPLKPLALKAIAFTLAETLIVIGIIGVVSALTLPNLNSSTGDKERVAKVKKIYQNLQDAFGRAEAVYGPYGTWIKSTDDTPAKKSKRIGERVVEFMKVSKNCNTETGKGCFSSSNVLELYSGNTESTSLDNFNSTYKFITADGTSVAIALNTIIVDIDGPTKGKNVLGNDIFRFMINDNNGILPLGSPECFDEPADDLIFELIGLDGEYCACWILRYDNADYLKLDSSGKCPNGTTPTDENPRCK